MKSSSHAFLFLLCCWALLIGFSVFGQAQAATQVDSAQQASNLGYSATLELLNLQASQDQWLEVKMGLKSALVRFPYDEQLISLQDQAQGVLQAQQMMKTILRAPNRLSDFDIRSDVVGRLSQVRPWAELSLSLALLRNQAAELVQAYATKQKVLIVSDGNTHIVVKRVGVVGRVTHKKVELPPGEYTFEGRCEGYKSKIVKATLHVGKQSAPIRVVCDEPL